MSIPSWWYCYVCIVYNFTMFVKSFTTLYVVLVEMVNNITHCNDHKTKLRIVVFVKMGWLGFNWKHIRNTGTVLMNYNPKLHQYKPKLVNYWMLNDDECTFTHRYRLLWPILSCIMHHKSDLNIFSWLIDLQYLFSSVWVNIIWIKMTITYAHKVKSCIDMVPQIRFQWMMLIRLSTF